MIILLSIIFIAVFYFLYLRYGTLVFVIFIVGLWWLGIDTVDRFFIPRTSLSLLMCVSTIIFLLIFKRKYTIINKKHDKPLYLLRIYFVGLFFLGLYGLLQYSKDTYNGTNYLLNTTILPFLILWIMWIVIDNDNEIELVLKLFYFTTTFFSIDLLYNYFNHLFVSTSLINTVAGTRLGGSPTFPFPFHVQYDPVSLGVTLSDIFPLFLSYVLFKFKKHFSYIYFIPLVLIIITIFLTGTRSAWIALSVSSILFISYGKISKARIKLIIALLISAVIIYNNYSYEINETLISRINSLQNIQSAGNFLQRVNMLNLGLDVTFSNPFGIGFGRLNRIIMNEHNLYTFITLGTGIIGLFIFLVIIFLICYYIRKNKHENNELRKNITLGGMGVLLAFLINGFADASIMETFQTTGVFISFGLALSSYKLFLLEEKK